MNTLKTIEAKYPTISYRQVMNICTSPPVVYITNQKAGCSSIKLFLARVHKSQCDLVIHGIHKNNPLPRAEQLGDERVCDYIDGAAFRFSFVRDPTGRLVSAYRDKILAPPGPPGLRELVNVALNKEPDQDVTFDEFISYLEQTPASEMNPHWRPQHINLMLDVIRYEYVGRLEDFATGMREVKRLAGLPDYPLPHWNRSGGRRGVPEVDPAPFRARIHALYRDDFEAFGY